MALEPAKSFQDLILTLHQYWSGKGCVILQPYDMEMGAMARIRTASSIITSIR